MGWSKRFLTITVVLFFSIPAFCQVYEAWVARYNGPENYNDAARAIAVDDSGNVYVTGDSYSLVTGIDFVTVKYTFFGDTAWVRWVNGSGNGDDYGLANAVDVSGNAYVTGYTVGNITGADCSTIKYAPNVDTNWVRHYNGPANSHDAGISLALDGDRNLYVVGRSEGSATGLDFATIKYAPNGDTIWVRRYDGPGSGDDTVNALAVDGAGYVYVTGESYAPLTGYDFVTIKYSPQGEIVWVRHYNGPANGTDYSEDIAVDEAGCVYVTGFSEDSATYRDYTTIKYSPSGDTLWIRRYYVSNGDLDWAKALAVDESLNVYVTGGSGYEYATIKYTPDGNTGWVRRYDGPGYAGNTARAVAIDQNGSVYVTGFSSGYGTDLDYATVKYSKNGDVEWVRRYDGPASFMDLARAMVLDKCGNVYVTGSSWGSFSKYDFGTIKYCLWSSGEVNQDGKTGVADIVYLINMMFKSWQMPGPTCLADVNGDGYLQLSDIIYLANYIFKSGPGPVVTRECCGVS